LLVWLAFWLWSKAPVTMVQVLDDGRPPYVSHRYFGHWMSLSILSGTVAAVLVLDALRQFVLAARGPPTRKRPPAQVGSAVPRQLPVCSQPPGIWRLEHCRHETRTPCVVDQWSSCGALLAAGWGAYTFLWPSSNTATTTKRANRSRPAWHGHRHGVGRRDRAEQLHGQRGLRHQRTITQINVKVGDNVSKGQQLAHLDDAQARLQLSAAKSNLAAAKDNLATAEATAATTTNGQQTRARARASSSCRPRSTRPT